MTMSADIARPKFESDSRVRSTKVVYAALFLIVTSGLFYALSTEYSIHLVSTKRFSLAGDYGGILCACRITFLLRPIVHHSVILSGGWPGF